MKVQIPLNSSLCTDSHKNEIKDPLSDNELFSKNQSYLYKGCLTNPKKTVIHSGNYITTGGEELEIVRGSEKTQIYNKGRLIADVLSLGIENVSFLDRDDAVIDQNSLWTVKKTLNGYTLEETDLLTQAVTVTEIEQNDILEVRLIRNTHKVITRNVDNSITIDGQKYSNQDMSNYLASYNGEFTAVEVNGKIYFGYNNPSGITKLPPINEITINITSNINNWRLSDNVNIVQNERYIFNVNVAAGVQIGSTSTQNFAMDFLTGIPNPIDHIINLNVAAGAIISGKGGDGGSIFNTTVPPYYFRIINGENGGTAINAGSPINITGDGTIQGGGGGGAPYVVGVSDFLGGGGAAGIQIGIGGNLHGNMHGDDGTYTTGGNGALFIKTVGMEQYKAGNGGNPASNGGEPAYYRNVPGSTPRWVYEDTERYGLAGNAIRIITANITISGVNIKGMIARI